MNVLLTLFARSVRTDIAPSPLDLYENLKYFTVQPTLHSLLIIFSESLYLLDHK